MRYILGGHRTDLFFLPRYGSGFIGPSNVMASNFSPDAQISKSPMLKLFVAMRRFRIYFGYFCGGRLHFFATHGSGLLGSIEPSAYSLILWPLTFHQVLGFQKVQC